MMLDVVNVSDFLSLPNLFVVFASYIVLVIGITLAIIALVTSKHANIDNTQKADNTKKVPIRVHRKDTSNPAFTEGYEYFLVFHVLNMDVDIRTMQACKARLSEEMFSAVEVGLDYEATFYRTSCGWHITELADITEDQK